GRARMPSGRGLRGVLPRARAGAGGHHALSCTHLRRRRGAHASRGPSQSDAASERDEQDPRWPHKRLPPGKKRTRKRMGMVAAVYGVEPHRREPADIVRQLRPVQSVTARQKRPHPVNKRVWASVTESGSEVIEQAFAEALLRDPEQERRWLVLVDGDKKQLRAVRKTARELGVEVTIILDVIHVLEYLWEAAYSFHPPGSKEAEQWVTKRLTMLLEGVDASAVAAG